VIRVTKQRVWDYPECRTKERVQTWRRKLGFK
jgi:hypothetical protein